MYVEQKSSGKWLARYRDDDGKLRSAGTFAKKEDALKAAEAAEHGSTEPLEEESENAAFAAMPLRDYVYEHWLTDSALSVHYKRNIESRFRRYLDPELGHLPLGAITTRQIRKVLRPHIANGRDSLARSLKASLGSIYKQLVDIDEYLDTSPVRGIRVPKPKAAKFTPLGPDEFHSIMKALPEGPPRFFAQFLVGTGLRLGEAMPLRVSDFDARTKELHVMRKVSSVGRKYTTDRRRYLILPGTKAGEGRVVPLSEHLSNALLAHINAHQLEPDDLLFGRELMTPPQEYPEVVLGDFWTKGNANFQHGTNYSYTIGACRCRLCRNAVNDYRRRRRAEMATGSRADTDELMAPEAWSKMWSTAVKDAGITWAARTHDLRHAHATILLASGADIYEVQKRLGHASITTTEIYLHRVKAMMSKAASMSDVYLSPLDDPREAV